MYWPLNTLCKKNVERKPYHSDMSDEDEAFDKMEKGEASRSTARIATSGSAAEEGMDEESEA